MQTQQLVSKYAICYGIFFLLTIVSKLNEGQKLFDQKGAVRNPGALAGLQIAGILWLGIIPARIFDQPFTTVVLGAHFPGIYKLVVCAFLAIIAVIGSSRQANVELPRILSQGNYLGVITRRFFYRYFILRIIFLIAYEAWFRGYLLMDCVASFGIIPAIIVNVSLYTLLHLFSHRKEVLACLPFGVLLCLMSIWTEAAWPAILMHIAVAFTYEFKWTSKFLTHNNSFA